MTSQFKRFIESLASPKGPGPSTTFSMFHIVYALELMAEKPIGRNKLAEKLNVGEGAIRTIISRLKGAGLIATSKEGCRLTDKGLSVWKKFVDVYPKRAEIGKTALTTSKYNYAFLVKNKAHKVKSGIDQRDAAIMGGARRAVVIVSKKGRLIIESVSNSIAKEFPEAASEILEKLEPEDNDVIIIAGADNPVKAKRGAFAASWVLIDNDEKM
jgi:DNA-binding MarR family transcriptional regulator